MRTLNLTNPPQRGASDIQRALHAAGLYSGKVDDLYGNVTAHAAYVAKWRLGYPLSGLHKEHEYAGGTLLAYLRGTKPLPASYRKRRAARLHPPGKEDTTREKVVTAYRYLIANEPAVHYRQSRPIPFPPPLTIPRGGLYIDCSGAVTIACKWGGAPDPNGLGYSGLGYTGTLLSHLPHISRAQVEPGDLAVFGRAPGHHVAMILDRSGTDFEIGSHGSERGPLDMLLSVEERFQLPPVTFLAIL